MNHACLSHSILLTLVFVHHMNNIWMMMMMMIIIIRWMREFLSIYSFEKKLYFLSSTPYFFLLPNFASQILSIDFLGKHFFPSLSKNDDDDTIISTTTTKKNHFFFVDNNRWSRFFSSSSSSILIHFECCLLLLLLSPSLLRDLLLR